MSASSLRVDRNKQAIYRRKYEAKFGPGNYAKIKKIQMLYRRSKTDCSEKEDALRDLLKQFRKNKKTRRDDETEQAMEILNKYKHSYSTASDRKLTFSGLPTVLKHPFSMMISGPSQSGKTTFVNRLIQNKNEMIEPNVKEILWFYGAEGSIEAIKETYPDIQFFPGLPDISQLEKFDSSVNRLMIIDDLMLQKDTARTLSDLFTKSSHHKNISVIFIVQNVFEKALRTASINSKYIVVFKNPRDQTQITTLGTQMFGKGDTLIKKAYSDISKTPHSYLLLDFDQEVNPCKRVRSNIFPDDEENFIYIKKGVACDEEIDNKKAVSCTELP